jgi:hypothetical protein
MKVYLDCQTLEKHIDVIDEKWGVERWSFVVI